MYKTREEVQQMIYALRGFVRKQGWRVFTFGQQMRYSCIVAARVQEINMAIRLGEYAYSDFKW